MEHGAVCCVSQKPPSEGRVNPGVYRWRLCSGRLTDGLDSAKYTTYSFSFKPHELPWSMELGGGGWGMKLFPIDCLIAPEAACPRPLAKSGFFFFLPVAKVRLDQFPTLSPRFEEGNPESPERRQEPGVCWPLLFKGVLPRQGCWDEVPATLNHCL